MKRIAATTMFAMSLLPFHAAVAQTGTGGPTASAATDKSAAKIDSAARAAGEVARAAAARQLNADPGEFSVATVEPAQWSDSSLGCRRPGLMYQQVITNGYVVVLERQGRQHRVNVAGERAVMCEAPTRASVRRPMQARGLTQMTELARSDLAARLKLDVAAIRVTQIEPQRWTDSDMNCGPSQTPATATETAGYRLALTAADRVYLYHTDLKTVRPCPPVEDQ